MKFLLQIVGGKVRHDFVFEMEHAIDYLRWLDRDVDAAYCSLEEITTHGCGSFIDADGIRDYVPIGTIEFVHSFIDKFIKEGGSKELKPLNVPEPLFKYAGRKITNCSLQCMDGRWETFHGFISASEVYVKSNDRIKDEANGSYPLEHILHEGVLPNGNYQISGRMEIVSEYRCFIYNGALKGIHYYSGDVGVFPKKEAILAMIGTYCGTGNAPQAWTLDVGITSSGETVVVECHEFYSCGLYGFSDYNALPYMFYRAFSSIKRRIQNQQPK